MRVFKPLVLVLACAAGSVPGALVAAQLDRAGVERFVNDRTAKHQQRRDVAVARVRQMGFPVRRRLAGGKVIEVKRLVNGRPVYYTTDNENAADTISSDELWSGGSLGLSLDGTGQRLGIWDGGRVRNTHQELTGRVTNLEAASVPLSNHATHVSGTMIAGGVAAGARGMASAAALRSWDFGNDEVEMALEQLAPNAVRVSNHSYSFITGWTDAYLGSHPCGWV